MIRVPRKSPTPISDDQYMDVADVADVTGPVDSMVDESMAHGWKVNHNHPMWLIFDVISPVRQFKRGMEYDDDEDFPAYGPADERTETDDPEVGLMPYAPILYK